MKFMLWYDEKLYRYSAYVIWCDDMIHLIWYDDIHVICYNDMVL